MATIYQGDCLEILPELCGLRDGCQNVDVSVEQGRGAGNDLKTRTLFDAVITDPPYGVDFLGKVTKHTINRPGMVYNDTPETFASVVLPGVRLAISVAKRAAIFCGTRRLQEYPTAADIGGIVCPNGGGRSSWGFGCFHPVLFYGKNPYMAAGLGARPTAAAMYHPGMHVTGENDNKHPCPKPIAFMDWAVGAASLDGEVVCDPFMGSGTTGVSCMRLGRKFIGIEIEPIYFEIACERIDAAQRQERLFA